MSDELAYLQKRLDELTGQAIKADAVISSATRELRQKRQAFAVLSDLHRTITTDLPTGEVYTNLLEAIRKSLKMDRSVILERNGFPKHSPVGAAGEGESLAFRAVAWGGMEPVECLVDADPDLVKPNGAVLATKNAAVTPFIARVRNDLGIPFFVGVPIFSGDRVTGLLLSGRAREMKPFFPALDEQDVHTMAALAGFLGSALTNARLFETQRKMTEAFRRFVPMQFLQILGRESILDVGLGDQVQKTMTILFSDIRSFTSLSEKMTPKENFDFINRYLEFVAPAIQENGGFIDKYIGDAIMALFPGDADSAVRAAIGLHKGLAAFNREWNSKGNSPIHIGVGLHTGSLMLGTIGFRERMENTVIADAVNLASRMEGLTKQYGAGILLTGETRNSMGGQGSVLLRLVDRVMVKGKHAPVEIFEIYECDPQEDRAAKSDLGGPFLAAMASYRSGDFQKAAEGFEAILARNPRDGAAALLARRSRKLLNDPPAEWQGVVGMEK